MFPSTSSLKVFSHFFQIDETGECVREEILTSACFNSWVASRKSILKHPEASFRRTVCAHLRGADGRNPFPPAVENVLLTKLRKDPTLWRQCFPHYKKILGKRGFYCVGFHELKKHSETKKIPKSDTTELDLVSLDENDADRASRELVESMKNYLGLNKDSNSVAALVCKRLLFHIKPGILQKILKTLLDQGNLLVSPSLLYFFDTVNTLDDPRLTRELLNPSEGMRFFDPSKPYGQNLVCRQTLTIVETDKELRRILGTDVVGSSVFTIAESSLESCVALSYYIEEFFRTGEVWIRTRWMTASGKPKIVLIYMKKLSEKVTFNRVQDQTDLFPGMIDRPFFV